MNYQINNLKTITAQTVKLLLASALLSVTSISYAEETSVAYVDSVLKWGAWELDLEPAAGGLSAASTRALTARNSKVALRTNSNAALAPPSGGAIPALPIVPGTPILPPVIPPIAPTVPTITPVSPNIPIPIGGPGGTATAPTLSPASGPVPIGAPGLPSGGPGAS